MVSPSKRPGSRSAQIQHFIEQELRPLIREDGGDLGFDSVAGNIVHIYLGAACATCPAKNRTALQFVQPRLREKFGPKITVSVRTAKPYFTN